jgi:hypothetical protein
MKEETARKLVSTMMLLGGTTALVAAFWFWDYRMGLAALGVLLLLGVAIGRRA